MFYFPFFSGGRQSNHSSANSMPVEGLPLAELLPAAEIDQVFAETGVDFGQTGRTIFTPAVTLWAFLGQVLGENKWCCQAVLRVMVLLAALGRRPCAADTAAYCRARAKLPALVIRRLANRLADRLEEAAQPWHWKQRVVQLVDGTTVSMPDTPANQERYPQPRTQRPGVGFPVLRLVALLSLATAAVHDIAIGPYKGKETGETALFRSLLDDLSAGEIVLADRYYCSYFMIALLMARGIDVVFRLHQQRAYDFRRGRRLGHGDHVVVWHKPAKPRWMDAEQYAALPDTLTIREVRYAVNQPGFRVREIILATTLLDAETYSAADLADLYHQRWHTELDLRYLKTTMKMDVLRCQTPAMIERELETYILGYNVVRKATVQAALLAQQAEEATRAPHPSAAEPTLPPTPRQISFAAALHTVLAAWDTLTRAPVAEQLSLVRVLLTELAKQRVADRPGRVEPRATKRRPKPHKLLQKPRAQARAELMMDVAA